MQRKVICGGQEREQISEATAERGATRIVDVAPPWGKGLPHDSNGRVPEFEGDYTFDNPNAIALCKTRTVGGRVRCRIFYDMGRIMPMNPGPNDLERIRAHERAHARGWDHGEGTPKTNPAYWGSVQITGR